MNVTKQGTRYKIDLPETVLDVLKWHVESQLHTPEQQDSDLLFPSITGGFRCPTVPDTASLATGGRLLAPKEKTG